MPLQAGHPGEKTTVFYEKTKKILSRQGRGGVYNHFLSEGESYAENKYSKISYNGHSIRWTPPFGRHFSWSNCVIGVKYIKTSIKGTLY